MALKNFVEDVLANCNAIPHTSDFHVRVWNNQLAYANENQLQSYKWPAIFPEFIFEGASHDAEGMTVRDCTVRFHIVHEQYNVEGEMEQNLDVFSLRDLVLQYFSKWHKDTTGYPYNFSPFQYSGEQMQYDHTQLYEYIVEFRTTFSEILGTYATTQQTNGTIQTIITNVSHGTPN